MYKGAFVDGKKHGIGEEKGDNYYFSGEFSYN